MTRTHEITGGGLTTGLPVTSPAGTRGAAGGKEALRDRLKVELAAAEAAAKKRLESEWWDNSHLTVAAETEGMRSLRTRHRPPWEGPWSTYGWLNLDRVQLRRSIAIHEAGHLVLGRQVGMPVKEAAIADDLGLTPGQEPAGYVTWGPEDWFGPWKDFAMVAAAGEQAQMRWLKDEGLYTERRGWAVEAHAWHDRHAVATQAAASSPPVSVSFGQPGTADFDWADLLHAAERHLDQRWSQLLEVADALDQHGHLNGADIDRIINPSQENRR
jgi:hypothetical protein